MTKTPETVRKEDAVTFVDSVRKEHAALVTEIFMSNDGKGNVKATCINVVYVSGDENETDSYGRQIKRETSICHQSVQTAGNYWK